MREESMKEDIGCIAVALVMAAVIIGLFLFVGTLIKGEQDKLDSFVRQCNAQGGHIYKPDSVSFCLTEDSRFIEVYP